MGFFGSVGDAIGIGQEIVQEIVADAVAEEAFGQALDMCGNEGQISVIESIGYSGFMDAAEAATQGDDAGEVLLGWASYPEAVEEICGEVGEMINSVMEALGEDNDELQGEDGEEEEAYEQAEALEFLDE